MNYRDYFPHLTKVECKLIDKGYWSLGFVDSHKKEMPILVSNKKWSELVYALGKLAKKKQTMITEEMILSYIDKPSRYKYLLKDRTMRGKNYFKSKRKVLNENKQRGEKTNTSTNRT